MQPSILHPWNLPIAQAKALQAQLAQKVRNNRTFDPIAVHRVAGVDVSFRGEMARAAIVILGFPGLEPVDYALAEVQVACPYVPGLLAFREGPSVLAALERLHTWPDLFLFDAHGLAHPRRLGLAAHMGVILDWPSIGCAKSRLIGHHDNLAEDAGAWVPLVDAGQTIGAAVRSRTGVQPVYVSIGHRIDLPTAIDFVIRCTRGRRLPETTRYAHQLASGVRLDIAGES